MTLATAVAFAAALAAQPVAPAPPAATAKDATTLNPIAQPWTGPYGGVPPFGAVKVADFEAALEAGMAEQLRAIDAIAADPAPATFENTLAALERSGRTLDRVARIFGIWGSSLSTPEYQAVELAMAPRLAAFGDKITQNEKLFARIAAVYQARQASGLDAEQQRLAWLQYTTFVRAGARLDAAAKKRVAAINERLATLFTTFSQRILSEEAGYVTLLTTEAELAGLPASVRAAMASAAEAAGHKGQWAVLNTRSSVEPLLSYSSRRDLRERSGATSSPAATTATRATPSRSSPRSWRSVPSGPRCSATPPTPTGGWRTPWPVRPSGPWRSWRRSGRRRWRG